MTRDDLQIFCTALGFATVFATGVPENADACKARRFGKLIEAYCLTVIPEAFGSTTQNIGDENGTATIDQAIARYKAALVDEGSAQLPDDRQTLLKFYDRLRQRQQRHQERHFYATGSDDMIAERVRQMVEEEITNEESET